MAVQIRRHGHPPKYKAFTNRPDAEAWARQIESEMDRGIFVSRVEAEKINLPDNPVKLITRPKVAPGRQRRLEPVEEAALLAGCRASGATALPLMFQLALETAMLREEPLGAPIAIPENTHPASAGLPSALDYNDIILIP